MVSELVEALQANIAFYSSKIHWLADKISHIKAGFIITIDSSSVVRDNLLKQSV
jgi:hypothetical protein